MLEFFILSKFISALLTLLVGVGLLLYIRKKTKQNAKENRPAGLWLRAICFGTDLAIIDLLNSFLAFHGSLQVTGYITALVALSYLFFFWIFFAATPGMMLVRIKILSKNNEPLKIWQALVRLGMFIFLFIGWITMLFDKKEKKALHDIVSQTRVAYTEKEIKPEKNSIKNMRFIILGMAVILLIGLIVYGKGEKMANYTRNDQVKFFDLNKDKINDGLTMDLDKDGKADVFKYDLNNDHVVDFTTLDADKDGVAESIDINNDGRIDGYDFDNDNIIDIPVWSGQFFIWFWKVLFGLWGLGFAAFIVFVILKENNKLFQK